jgi:hypothetical protein
MDTYRTHNFPGTQAPLRYSMADFAAPCRNRAGSIVIAQAEHVMAAYGAYTEAMKKAGVHVGSNRLRPTTSGTTVRVANGKTEVLDGPYAETKEQLGGYYMIEVPDLDAALSWAARCPGASHGTIEVRPLWVM